MAAARRKGQIINHAQMRAKERYGVDLDVNDLRQITRAIQDNQGTLLLLQKDGKSIWSLTYKNVEMRLVMDPTLWKVLTFLPLTKALRYRPKRRRTIFRGGRLHRAGEAA